jgi:hypothetical protein
VNEFNREAMTKRMRRLEPRLTAFKSKLLGLGED